MTTMNNSLLTAEEVYTKRKIRMAISGMIFATISSITSCVNTNINGIMTGMTGDVVGADPIVSVITAITIIAATDFTAGLVMFVYNMATGRSLKEYKRLSKVRPKISWMLLASAVVCGPLGMGVMMASAFFAGVTYAAMMCSFTSAVSAIGGRIIFKESLSKRVIVGIVVATVGVLIASYMPPENAEHFYLGLILACLCPIMFAADGMLGTYGTDLLDPATVVGTFRTFGSAFSGIIIVVIMGAIAGDATIPFAILKFILTTPLMLVCLILVGIIMAISYYTNYLGFNRTGPTRALVMVGAMPLWSIPVGYIFQGAGWMEYSVNALGIIGAIVVVAGLTFVVAKPSELANLRNQ